jgi:hypothetical protein
MRRGTVADTVPRTPGTGGVAVTRTCSELSEVCKAANLGKDEILQVYNEIVCIYKEGTEKRNQVLQVMKVLTQLTVQYMRDFEAQDMKTIFKAFAKCDVKVTESLASGLKHRVRSVIENFEVDDVADILWACVKTGIKIESDILRGLDRSMCGTISKCTSKCLARLTYSYAKLQHVPSEEIWQGLESHVPTIVDSFQPQDISNTLWAYATLGRAPSEDILGPFEKQAAAVVAGFKPQEISNVLWAYAKFGQAPSDHMLKALEEQSANVIEGFQPQTISNTLWAYATFGRMHSEATLMLLEKRATADIQNFKAQAISKILWSYVKLGRSPSEELWRGLEGQTAACLGSFKPGEIRNVHEAYGILGRKPSEAMLKVLQNPIDRLAASQIVDFSSEAVTRTLCLCAASGKAPSEDVLRALDDRAAAVAGSFQTPGISSILWAYATLGRTPTGTCLQDLNAKAVSSIAGFSHHELTTMLWASSCLPSSESSVKLVSAVASRIVSPAFKASMFEPNDLRLVHQFLVAYKLEMLPSFDGASRASITQLDSAYGRKAFKAFSRTNATVSRFHQDVASILKDLGAHVTMEARDAESGYSIDCLVRGLRVHHGLKIAVEVDGPSKFVVHVSDGGKQTPTGPTIMKRRHLALMGYTVIHVAHYEWEALVNTTARIKYIQEKLTVAVHAASKGNQGSFQ